MSAAEPQPAVLKPKRRWYQYTLRSLLVFVTLCAIPCSWLAIEAKDERDAVATIGKYYGEVTEKTSILHAGMHEPMRARTLGYFDRVESVCLVNQFYYSTEDHTDDIIRALKRLRYLKTIVIGGPSRLSSPPLADERIKKAMPSVTIVEFFQ